MTPEEIAKKQEEEARLIYKLTQMNEFTLWRDLVCKPVLQQLEDELRNSDNLSEPILRGKLKHYFSEKYRFYEVFEQIAAQAQINKDMKEIETERS